MEQNIEQNTEQDTENNNKKPFNKINSLFINITIKFIIFLVLIGLSILIIKVLMANISKSKKEIEDLNKKNINIIDQTTDIVNKSIAAKKYIVVWENELTKNQKMLTGISTQKIQSQIEAIAAQDKFRIRSITFSPVVIAGGSFRKTSITTYSTLVTIRFSTVTDINAFAFLNDLKEKLDNFAVITDVSLKRTKKITPNFLKKLNDGIVMTAIDGEFKIRLYGIEPKNK